MAGKPKKILVESDGLKRFGPEVFDLIRTKLAPMVGGNVNYGVKLAADHFAPRKPGEVTAAEMGDAIPQIVAKHEADTKAESRNGGGDGRLPLNDEAQKLWDSGQWRRKLTVHGLRDRFKAEIADGVDLTLNMLDAYAAELAAEKAKIAELVDEHDDPDSGPVPCASPVHTGEREFQPTVAFRLERATDGALVRRKHDKGGNEDMEIGNSLVREEEADQIPYCNSCREAARVMVREAKRQAEALRHQLTIVVSVEEKQKLQEALAEIKGLANIMLTFYTFAGAKRKLDAMKKSAEGHEALAVQLKSAGARTFGGRGAGKMVRADRDWRTTRSRGGKK